MTDEKRTDFWDGAYASGDYRQHWHLSRPSTELVALIASGIAEPGARVLDAGCGAGTESVFLAQCGYRATGVDVSEQAIAIARRAAADLRAAAADDRGAPTLDLEFMVADITALPCAESTFEFINDRGVFHLFGEELRAAYAREIARVLMPGGAIALRGSRTDGTDQEPFRALSAESIERHFPDTQFYRGPVLPVSLVADHGQLDGNMVVIRKRRQPARADGGVQVQGLGGGFFKAADPKALQAWYVLHLGLPLDDNGYVDLRWRPLHRPARRAQTVWSAFSSDTTYFNPGTASHMINYRVTDLHAAITRLRADGVQVMDDVEESEYGKFGWCLDPEGNKIELWQPPE